METYIVVAFNTTEFYVVSVCDNPIIAQNYAKLAYKERRASVDVIVYKKIMNAPQTMNDEVVFKIKQKNRL